MWLGPIHTVPLGSWLRCHGVPGAIHLVGIRHTGSAQYASPASTTGRQRSRSAWCAARYLGSATLGLPWRYRAPMFTKPWEPLLLGLVATALGVGVLVINATVSDLDVAALDVVGWVFAGLGGWLIQIATIAMGVELGNRQR